MEGEYARFIEIQRQNTERERHAFEAEIERQRATYQANVERLQKKDDQQQLELDALRTEHLECEKNNATLTERLTNLGNRVEEVKRDNDKKYDLFKLLVANKVIQLPETVTISEKT